MYNMTKLNDLHKIRVIDIYYGGGVKKLHLVENNHSI